MLLKGEYTRDNAGRITVIDAPGLADDWVYTYDHLDQLLSADNAGDNALDEHLDEAETGCARVAIHRPAYLSARSFRLSSALMTDRMTPPTRAPSSRVIDGPAMAENRAVRRAVRASIRAEILRSMAGRRLASSPVPMSARSDRAKRPLRASADLIEEPSSTRPTADASASPSARLEQDRADSRMASGIGTPLPASIDGVFAYRAMSSSATKAPTSGIFMIIRPAIARHPGLRRARKPSRRTSGGIARTSVQCPAKKVRRPDRMAMATGVASRGLHSTQAQAIVLSRQAGGGSVGSEINDSERWLREAADAIRAAGLNPDLWRDIPMMLANAWPGAKVLIQGCSKEGARSLGFLHHGFDDGEMARYHEYHCDINPWIAVLQRMPVLRASPSDETLPWWTFADGEFFNDFLKPQQNSEHGVAIKLFDEPGHFAWLGFQFGHDVADEYNALLPRALQLLAPALHAALTLNRQIARSAAIATVGHLIEAFDRPAFLIDQRRAVIAANSLGAAALDAGQVLQLDALGRMRLRQPSARAHAERQIERLFKAANSPGIDIAIRSPNGRLDELLSVFPLAAYASTQMTWLQTPERLAIVLLRCLDGASAIEPTALRQLFDLTHSEARLAVRLATGEAFSTAAMALGIGRETARTHLRALFAKTGTHRQAELVALLARLPGGNLRLG